MSEEIKKDERCSRELESLMSKFVPVFGDRNDIWIINEYGRIKKKIGEIQGDQYRELMREKKYKLLTPKMREIRDMERRLVLILKDR